MLELYNVKNSIKTTFRDNLVIDSLIEHKR